MALGNDDGGVDRAERAKIAGETARHYGNMRFAMFTVFSAVLGGLMSFAFSDAGSRFLAVDRHRVCLSIAGIVLSTMFVLAEYRISELVALYQEAAYRADALDKPPLHDHWKHVVKLTMILPYVLSAAFWAMLGFTFLHIPVAPVH